MHERLLGRMWKELLEDARQVRERQKAEVPSKEGRKAGVLREESSRGQKSP